MRPAAWRRAAAARTTAARRVMFFVKRELALTVRPPRVGRGGCGRSSPQVHDLDGRREEYFSPARTNRDAEIHIFHVHEVALVEQPDGLGVAAAHKKTRAS